MTSHHNGYFVNSTMLPESSEMKHHSGIAMDWTSEEQEILEHGLVRYSSEPSVLRYAKIALELQNKSVRDVALRCKWINKKENNKRRKEDHNGSGRVKFDNKEIIHVMASNPAPNVFSQSLLRQEHGINNVLLERNEKLFNEISTNLTSLRYTENLIPFCKSRDNIRKLLLNLNENVPEPMKRMPPLPEILSDELLDSIISSSNLST